MITEYTKLWNDEKKKQVAEKRKNVSTGIHCDLETSSPRAERERGARRKAGGSKTRRKERE